jgi:hypothetical protein
MTTTFYDRRAERQVAAAMADQHRAEAAARLADVELQHVRAEAARAELADKRHAAAQARKAAQRAEAHDRWAARARQVRAALAGLWRRTTGAVPLLVGMVAMGAPILIGWNGQLMTARAVLHLGGLSWVYPVALEGGAWWLAYLMHRAISHRRPTGRLRAAMWLLAALAAGMNVWHGTAAYGPIGGAGLGLSSLLGIALWELTAGHLRHTATGTTARHARLVLARWVRFPRLSLAAASIAAARGTDTDREAAWQAAWMDRYGVGPAASRRDRRLGRTIIRAQWDLDREAARRGELLIVGGVILRTLPTPDPTPESAPAPQPIVQPAETPDTGIVQPKLSRLAAALLPKVRAAIDAGELPVTPSARKIHARFKGSMDAASEVRDYLAATRPTTRKEAA